MSISGSDQKFFLIVVVLLVGLTICRSSLFGQIPDDPRAWSRVHLSSRNEEARTDHPVVLYSSLIARKGLPPTDSPDIQITPLTNTTQSENSVFVSPLNDNIVLNSNNSSDYPTTQIFGASGFVSTDGGLTWNGSVNGTGGTNGGDPAVAIGLNGRFYNNYIANDGGNGTAYSTNSGATWTHVQVAPNPGALADKNHLWVDNSPASTYVNNLYAGWTDFGGAFDSEIMISRSTNAGLTWSPKVAISTAIAAGNHNQGVNVQTGPNGEVYAAWAVYDAFPALETAIGFARSTNGGATWQPAVRAIANIKGIRSQATDGGLLGGKDMRTASFPSMSVNMQNGHIYIVWTNIGVPGVNTGIERDVYMSRSTDGGATWGTAVRVNQDAAGNGKDQWFPWISCDPVTGFLAVVFYDSRDFVANDMANTYVATSGDGGSTWEDFRVSDAAWSGDGSGTGFGSNYAGDYIAIAARNGKVYPVWTDRRASDGRLSSWASPFLLADPVDPNPPTNVRSFSDFTTPTSIALTWTNPTTLVNGTPIPPFVMRISRDGVQIAETPGTITSYDDTGLLDGSFHTYNLRTRLVSDDSLSPGVQTGWTAGGARKPSDPRTLTATGTAATGFKIRWTNPSTQSDGTRLDDFSGIRLYRDAAFIALLVRSSLDTGRVDSTLDLPVGGLHSYYVTAVDNETPVNESTPSNTAFTPLGFPFVDTFPVQGTPNPAIWISSNIEVNDLGDDETSAPFSMNLNGNPSGGDTAVALYLDLTGQQDSGSVLAFFYQPRGNGENPDPDDTLFVEFKNSLGEWIRAAAYQGLSTADSIPSYTFVSIAPGGVPPGSGTFFYNGFQFRFRTKSTVGLYDDWFIDDVFFGVPTGNPNMVIAPRQISDTLVVGNVDSTSYLVTITNSNPFAGPLVFSTLEDPDAPWLSAQPPAGSVSANSSMPVRLVVDFSSVSPGSYATRLVVSGNDTANAADTVNIAFVVNPPPQIGVTPDSLSFTVNEGDSAQATMTITNSGTGILSFAIQHEFETRAMAVHPFALSPSSHAGMVMDRRIGEERQYPPASSGLTPYEPGLLLHPVTTRKHEFQTGDNARLEGGQTLFGVMADSIVQIDLTTGQIVKSLHAPITTTAGPTGLAFSGSRLYLTDAFANTLIYVLNPTDGTVITSYAAPSSNTDGLAFVNGKLYATNYSLSVIYEMDPENGQVLRTITPTVTIGGGIDGGKGRFFASNFSTAVYELDINTGAVLNSFTPVSGIYGLGFTGDRLFASTPGGGIVEYNPDTGQFLGTISTLGFAALAGGGATEWLSESPTTGTVPPGGSQNITVRVRTDDLDGGIYRANILVNSNDPLQPTVTVPVHMTVIGTPNLVLSDDTLAFGDTFVGYPDTVALQLSNNGSDTLRVSGVSSGNPVFTALGSTVFTVAPRGTRMVPVQFLPTTVGLQTGLLTIASNDPSDPTVNVFLTGTGTEPPQIGVAPDSLSFTVNEGDSAATPLTISNTGLGPLSFQIQIRSAGTIARSHTLAKPWAMSLMTNPDERPPLHAAPDQTPDPSFTPPARHLYTGSQMMIGISDSAEIMPLQSPLGVEHLEVGGLFSGYTCAYFDGFTDRVHWSIYSERSGTLSGVSYTEIEDSPTRTVVEAVLRTSDNKMEIRRRFSFVKSSRAVALRVFVRNISSSALTNVVFKEDADWDVDGDYEDDSWNYDSTRNMIYASDVQYAAIAGKSQPDFATRDGWYYRTSRTTVDNRTPATQFDGFEILHYELGDLAPGEESTLDFVYAVGTSLADLQQSVDNGFAQLADWLSVTPVTGTVTSGGSQNVTARIRTDDLDGGTYHANILVNSNDPLQPTVVVPVRLTVIGTPNLVLSDDTLGFGDTFVGYPDTVALQISNNGSDTLRVSGVSSSNPVFTALGSTVFTVAPRGVRTVRVRFLPTTVGPQTGLLTITSNDPSDPTTNVFLDGAGIHPPIIGVDPDSLSLTLSIGDSAMTMLTINNTGLGDLTFNVTIQGAAATPPPLEARRNFRGTGEAGDIAGVIRSLINRSGILHGAIAIERQGQVGPGSGEMKRTILITNPDQVAQTTYGRSTPPVIGVAVLCSAFDTIYGNDVRSKLLGTGFFSSVSVINIAVVTPTLVELQAFDAVLVYGDAPGYQNSQLLGDVLADYVDAGGGVVCATFATASLPFLGRFNSANYWAIPPSGQTQFTREFLGTIYDPLHPILRGVQSFDGGSASFRQTSSDIASGATRIADWTDGKALVATKVINNTNRVDLGFFPPSSDSRIDLWEATTDGDLLLANSLRWVAEVQDWVSVDPASGTVTAGGSLNIGVTVRAGGLECGQTYHASIHINSNDPATPDVIVPVALRVVGAAHILVSRDTLEFTHSYVGFADTLGFLVTNAGCDTLRVQGMSSTNAQFSVIDPAVFSLAGDSSRVVRVRFLPASAGQHAATLFISNNDSSTPIYDVTMLGNAFLPPAVHVNPDSLSFTVNEGDSVTATMTIANSGLGLLSWQTSIVRGGAALYTLPAANQSTWLTEGGRREVAVDLHPRAALLADLTGKRIGITNWISYGILAGDLTLRGATVREMVFPINQAILDSLDLIAIDDAVGGATSSDITAIRTWLQTGKGLLLQGDDASSMSNINALLSGSGITETGLGNYFNAILTDIRSHPTTENVDTIDASGYGSYCTVNSPAAAIVFDDLSRPHVAVSTSGSGRIMAVGNEFSSDFGLAVGDTRLFANQVMDWLTSPSEFLWVTPDSGTVASGGSQDVQVKVRTGALNDGTYHASILVNSNDPLRPTVPVPVRLDVITDVPRPGEGLPTEFALYQNCPNPFNPTTRIGFDIPQLSHVTLGVFDILGREVATLVGERKTPGRYEVEWNTRGVASGVYLYRLQARPTEGGQAGNYVETRKMLLVR